MIFINQDRVKDLIEPVGLVVDINRLNQELLQLMSSFNFDPRSAITSPRRQNSFNLNFPTKLPSCIKSDDDLFHGELSRGEDKLAELYNLSTEDFTQFHSSVKQGYVWEVITAVKNWHALNNAHLGEITRIHCAFLANASGFQIHRDLHTTVKYHISLVTNKFCTMMTMLNVDSDEIYSTHIPADGRLWILDTQGFHTAMNLSPNIMKDNIRGHLIFSVTPKNS